MHVQLAKEVYPSAVLDVHIPSLVTLPPSTSGIADFSKEHRISMTSTAEEKNDGGSDGDGGNLVSTFIIQDKASCMPAQVLFEEYRLGCEQRKRKRSSARRTDFIDACAGGVLLYCTSGHIDMHIHQHSLTRDYDAHMYCTPLLDAPFTFLSTLHLPMQPRATRHLTWLL